MVMITSEDSAVSHSSFFGVWSVTSMPTSAMASTAAALIVSTGPEPAERSSTASPARWRSQPASICERPALCTHTNRTLGLSLILRSSGGTGGRGVVVRQ
jgi:hypothetical protein